MGKIRKRKSKRQMTVQNTRHAQKGKKLNKKPIPNLLDLRARWNKRETLKRNMQALGIAYDANKAVPIAQINPKTTAEEEEEPEMMTIEDAKRLAASSQQSEEKWIDGLSFDSNDLDQPGSIHFSEDFAKFLKKMIEKYGTDYERMQRDKKNLYQLTSKQLERKCRVFASTKLHSP